MGRIGAGLGSTVSTGIGTGNWYRCRQHSLRVAEIVCEVAGVTPARWRYTQTQYTHTLTHTYSLSHTHTLSHTHPLSHTHIHTHSRTHTHIHATPYTLQVCAVLSLVAGPPPLDVRSGARRPVKKRVGWVLRCLAP